MPTPSIRPPREQHPPRRRWGISSPLESCFAILLVTIAFAAIPAVAQASIITFITFITFESTGQEQTWVVPLGVFSAQVEALGARGGTGTESGGAGGNGALVNGNLSVTPGEILYVEVGSDGAGVAGGFNGGGEGAQYGAGGGGATDLRTVSMAGENRRQL